MGLIGAEQSEAYDTMPNCSTTIAKGHTEHTTNGVVANKKRLKLNCSSTKLKQSWECQERQSPIIEDSVMDGFSQGTTQRRKRSGGPGSGARRAMRKRISAARLALRKISRISTQSGSTIATMASSSSTHSSPKTPVSVHGYCGGNSPVWQSLNSNSTEHPLKKCLSRQLLEADEQNNNNKAVNDNDETEQQQQLVPMNGTGRHGVGAINWNGDEHHHQRQRHGDNDDEVENNRSKKLRKRSRTLAVAKELLFVKSDKKPLGPSLSWDPQQRQQQQKPSRSRTPLSALDGTNQRDRIHSDGSAEQLVHMRNSKSAFLLTGKNVPSTKGRGGGGGGGHFEKKSKGKRRKKSGTLPSGAERVEKVGLDLNCLHCALQAEHCASTLRSEIECAVKRLAIRLNSGGGGADDGAAAGCRAMSPTATCRKRAATTTVVRVEVETERQQLVQQQQQLRRTIGTPDIVISSYNSEDTPAESADEGFWTTSSATVKGIKQQQNQQKDNKLGSHSSSNEMDKGHSSESQLANAEPNDQQQLAYVVWSPMDTLKPPGGAPFGGSNTLYSSSSSASGSVAFIPSGHSLPGGMPSLGAVVGDHLNTPPRSNSVDLSLLRRDIERWSVSNLSTAGSTTDLEMVELKNNRGTEQELKRVSKHRTSRYWLEDQLGPSEHIWLTSSASASSTVDTECYLGEKDCQKMGEKRRCSGCHIVAHTACFPLLAKMNLSCKTTFRDCAVANASGAKRRAVQQQQRVEQQRQQQQQQQQLQTSLGAPMAVGGALLTLWQIIPAENVQRKGSDRDHLLLEPCLLGPSLIHLTFHNKVSMLRREKFARPPGTAPCNNIVSMGQNRRKSSQNSSANSSIAGGAAGGAVQASTTMMPTAGANGNGTVQAGGHEKFQGMRTDGQWLISSMIITLI
uniref:Phorbol-ester/DAG-type domain-containing protein n=1 Tax=Globodera pallida TaxID=36090 RepID=A0A183BL04_GLOPA